MKIDTSICETMGHNFVQPGTPDRAEVVRDDVRVYCTKCGEARWLRFEQSRDGQTEKS